MPVYRPLRVSIFIYDLVRLFGMLWVLPQLMVTSLSESVLPFPLIVYAAPNVLFLLAAFFLLVRFEEYRSYAYLYMAGKAVTVAANLSWFFFSLRRLALVLDEYALEPLLVLGFLLFLACLDALSVLGMSALVIYRTGKPDADGTAAEGAGLTGTGVAGPPVSAGTEE
ncbi:MAG: hypothetical protein LBH57_07980 [Treponema sp.]|jgi:hypothetical protein|nr:hypothetical protein [Treponema sp.]